MLRTLLGDLSQPLPQREPFILLLSLFSALIHLNVFSFSQYLSTLVARGDTKVAIIPSLPFVVGGSPPSPALSESDELSVRISLPLFGGSPQKKSAIPLIVKQEQTLSPRLPQQFGSQDSILPLVSMSTFGQFGQEMEEEEDEESESGATIKFEENVLFERQQQLEKLLSMTSTQDPLVSSPIDFNSTQHSPSSPPNADLFNMMSGPSLDDSQIHTHTSIDKQASRHLIFAAYFPIEVTEITKQDLNERAVVLCGPGKTRKMVENLVGEIRSNIEHHFRLLQSISSPVLPEQIPDVMNRFRLLPTFYQNQISCGCAQSLLSSLSPSSPYPSCSQLVFVCQLLLATGSVQQTLDLIIDVVSCNGVEKRDSVRHPFPPLPNDLCFPVVSILWCFTSSLLLSVHDTSLVFER